MSEKYFVPYLLHGLRLTSDSDSDLFDDCTVVSGEKLQRILHEIGLNIGRKDARPGDPSGYRCQAEEDLIGMAEHEVDPRAAYLQISAWDGDPFKRNEIANQRAQSIGAVLSLAILARTGFFETVCLDAQIQNVVQTSRSVISFEHGIIATTMGPETRAWLHRVCVPPIEVSTDRLLDWLNDESVNAITDAICFRKKEFDSTVRETMERCIVLLYETLSTSMPEFQLLAAVTVCESICKLSSTSDRWKDTLERFKTLIGSDWWDDYEVERFFHLRNGFAHEGRRVTKSEARGAAVIAWYGLCAYAKHTRGMKNHHAFAELLEFTRYSQRLTATRYDPLRSIGITSGSGMPDMRAFRFVAYCISNDIIATKEVHEQRKDVTVAVIAFGLWFEVYRPEAFDGVTRTITRIAMPFATFREFEDYVVLDEQALLQKAESIVANLKSRGVTPEKFR